MNLTTPSVFFTNNHGPTGNILLKYTGTILRYFYNFFTIVLQFLYNFFTILLQFFYNYFTIILRFFYNSFTICLQFVYNSFKFLYIYRKIKNIIMTWWRSVSGTTWAKFTTGNLWCTTNGGTFSNLENPILWLLKVTNIKYFIKHYYKNIIIQ